MRKTIPCFIFFFFYLFSSLMARDWYVRPAGGAYSSENGTSYVNAWDGLASVVWGAGGVQAGDTLWVCGTHLPKTYVGGYIFDWGPIPSGGGESTRTTIRGDYPGDPGIFWGGFAFAGAWTYEGNWVWSHSCPPIDAGYENLFFENISGVNGTRLVAVASLALCQSTPGSVYMANWSAGGIIYMHCTDGLTPEGRSYGPVRGWRPGFLNRQYITFLSMTYRNVCHNTYYNENYCSYVRWEGCDFKWEHEYMMALGGYTASDRFHHIEVINCEMSYAENGIYTIGDTDYAPTDCVFRGNRIHDMGVLPGMSSTDAHGIGIQGGNNNIIENNEIYNCGTGITCYAFTNQRLTNTTIRYNYCHNMHQITSNGNGIEFNCNNDSLSDKTGNRAYYNIVAYCPGHGFQIQFEDRVYIWNNVVYYCGTNFWTDRSTGGSPNYGPDIQYRNNISVAPTWQHIRFSPGNATIYSCDADYNLYYPDNTGLWRWNSSYYSFSGWQGRGQDTHSPTLADPGFINTNGDFHLQPNSPAVDRGMDVGLTQDRDGISIPQGFAPDIGAYECIKYVFVRIDASTTSGQIPLVVNFLGNARGDFPPFTFSWSFGDGQTSAAQNPSHTYFSHGNYTASMTVTDSRNNRDSVSVTINAYRKHLLSLSTLTGAPAPDEGGTANPSPGSHSYDQGSSSKCRSLRELQILFVEWRYPEF
jgi:PKD repeat protein